LYERIPERMDFVEHPSFADSATEARLFDHSAETIDIPQWTSFPEVPEEAPAGGAPRRALRRDQEARLFLRYNYARYRLRGLQARQRQRPTAARSRRMVHWFERVLQGRSDIVQANMALVVAMARRTRIPNVDFPELVSEGNMALLRAVEKFDVSRGFKFSTYACRAILKGFNRLATKTSNYRQRFCTEYDPALEPSDYDVLKHEMAHAESVDALREILSENRAELSDVERTVVMERYAIGSADGRRRTLADVGKMVGLTNERVRQIQKHALAKLRAVLDEDYLAA
jgi:RNA polymerase sigma factor (sigma-70 family)